MVDIKLVVKRRWLWIVVLAAFGLFTAAYWHNRESITLNQNEPLVRNELDHLGGLWWADDGAKPETLFARQPQLMIERCQWTDGPWRNWLGQLKVDPTKNPRRIDFIWDDGTVSKAIYECEGDALKICLGLHRGRPTNQRPLAMPAAGAVAGGHLTVGDSILWIYRRRPRE
jgi:uncharacterized protein (TIGR03067 family)